MPHTKLMQEAIAQRRELKLRARLKRNASIKACWLEGLETFAIAERFGLTVDTVRNILQLPRVAP